MNATTILAISISVTVLHCETITTYIEHNALESNPDFLHVHLAPKSLRAQTTTKTTAKPKMVFKLPQKLPHDELFELIVCPSLTMEALKEDSNAELADCLTDQFNSVIGLSYDAELPIYQTAFNNFVKTCFFGVASMEAEHSYEKMDLNDLHQGKTVQDENLYFKDANEVIEKYSDSTSFNLRLQQNAGEDLRCALDLDSNIDLEETGFTGDVLYIKKQKTLSKLVLGYNDNSGSFKNPTHISRTMVFPPSDYNDLSKKRQQIVDSLKKSLVFQKSSFEERRLIFSLTTSPGSIPVLTVDKGGDHTSTHQLPFVVGQKTYLRFVPVVCRELMFSKLELSYLFLDANECQPVTDKKLLITDLGKGFRFVYLEGQKASAEEKLDLPFFAMDFHYFPKEEPLEVIKMKGFEKRCDVMFDEERDVVFYVCYQKIRESYDDKEKPIAEENLQNQVVKIINNGDQKVYKRLLEVSGKAAKFLLIVIVICAFVAVLSVFFWSIKILTIICLFIIILCVIGIFMTGSDDRLLAELTNNQPTEVVYKRSFSAFLDKRQMRLEKAKIQNLNKVTPALFETLTPVGDLVICDAEDLIAKFLTAEQSIADQAKIILSKGTNKQKKGQENKTVVDELATDGFNMDAIQQAKSKKDLRIKQASKSVKVNVIQTDVNQSDQIRNLKLVV